MRSKYKLWASAIVFTSFAAAAANAQVRPVYDLGTNALSRQLQRLQTTASVLHTGAHPDDEDSGLIAYHARRENARTAYLSLTRGSGGQNIIGAEQGDLLGIIRTEELLQARRLDGAEQLFTRANDFGFSKHRTEASRVWDEKAVLGDMVRAIRRFRPSVVVSRWSGTPADGHGHHQFAGYLTPQAIAAAADPVLYPEHLAAGLTPWKVQKLYVSEGVNPGDSAPSLLLVNTGEFDPVTGRSYFEIGMEGRSQQKTQQMGSLELRGRQLSGLRQVEVAVDAPAREESIFDGLDTTISGIALYETKPSAAFKSLLKKLEKTSAGILANFDPVEPEALVPALVDGLSLARKARDEARAPDARRLLDEKIREFESALVLAAGFSVDALADSETVVPGGTLQVAVRLYGADAIDVDPADIRLTLPDKWELSRADAKMLSNELNSRRQDQPDSQSVFDILVPAGAEFTEPYWLKNPRDGFTYDWSDAGIAWNLPFDPPLMMAEVMLTIGGARVTVRQEVQYRYVDRIRGEIRRRIDVVPAISVDPAAELAVVPASSETREFDVLLTVRNNTDHEISGIVRLEHPNDWTLEPASTELTLAAHPASSTLAFKASLPDTVTAGEYLLQGTVTIGDTTYDKSMREISYPHIQTHRVYSDSTTRFKIIDVDIAPVRIGYVMGSGDKIPETLQRLGVDIIVLDDAELTTGNLSRFDVIVIGIRASQTRPSFVANNSRLLQFAERGGTLIVQYQQPDFIEKGLAPFPASMDGNVRVVDETAPVTVLEPEHPVFNFPNRITPEDFDGWIQERNNYNFTSFDRDHYIPLTESHDEGETESDGGMLYARIGKGHYIYTSYSWFRQLPNGTSGGYRLFANLLSLPAAAK